MDETWAAVALMNRLVARDPTALAELYDSHSRLLFGLILRIVKNRAEAEEVLQEVFVQVWTRAHTYTTSLGSPAGWLVGIARNRAIDRLRAKAVHDRVAEAAPEPAACDDPETHATIIERRRTVQQALNALPAEQRELIQEAYFLGLTQSELAERYRLPLGTVKTRIRSGLIALRGNLEGRYLQQ